MKLYDVGEKERIQIIARNESASLQYLATVVMMKQNILFIEPIMHRDKIVNFNTSHVTIRVVYIGEGEKPLVWDGCVIKTIIYQNKKYQVVYSDKEGKKLNRREAYRQYIGAKGILKVDATREVLRVTVKDISTTGISFVTDTSVTMADIGDFHLNFDDPECKLGIRLAGYLIQEEDVDENRRVFGGVIKACNVDLSTYVALKQKNEMARRSGK